MKFGTVMLALVGCVVASSAALAVTADDIKWVNQCLRDNRNEGVSMEIVRKYCVCMNNKMSNNETRSITQWEKSHPRERKECDRVSGWR